MGVNGCPAGSFELKIARKWMRDETAALPPHRAERLSLSESLLYFPEAKPQDVMGR